MTRVVLVLLLLLPSQALGWGSQGHQAIADAAQTGGREAAERAREREG
jgi:hypothetical protein